MTIALPWNHRPSSTSALKTGAYTLPAGKFARISVLGYTADFVIDGVVIITAGHHFQNVNGTGSIVSGGPYATDMVVEMISIGTPSGSCNLTFQGGGASSYAVSAALLLSGSGKILIQKGSTFDSATLNDVSLTVKPDVHVPREYWVNAGTALNGDSYYVEEYDVP